MRLLVLAKDSKVNGWEGAAGPQSGPGLEPVPGVFLRSGPAVGTGELGSQRNSTTPTCPRYKSIVIHLLLPHWGLQPCPQKHIRVSELTHSLCWGISQAP